MNKIIILFLSLTLAGNLLAQDDTFKNATQLADDGKFGEALMMIDKVIASNPPQAIYFIEKSNYQIELQDYDNVINTLSAGIKALPKSDSLYLMRGVIFEAFRMFDKSIEDYTTGFEVTEDPFVKARMLSNRGGMKSRIRDYQGAYDDLIIAIEYDSNFIDAYNNLATVCDEVGKPEETLVYLEKILRIDSTYVPAYVNLGFKYQIMNKHEEAITYFDKAVELSPEEPLGYSNRGFSRLKTGDLKGALKDINYSLELYPSNSYAYKIRAMIHIEEKKLKLACHDLETALQLGYTKEFGPEVDELKKKHCQGVISN